MTQRIKIKTGDLVKPNYAEMIPHRITIQVDNSPWEVTKVYDEIVTVKRKSETTGKCYYDRFHEDFLTPVVHFQSSKEQETQK
jgi:DNA-directed RNA polymerase subunit H (RpoH/RPB5)